MGEPYVKEKVGGWAPACLVHVKKVHLAGKPGTTSEFARWPWEGRFLQSRPAPVVQHPTEARKCGYYDSVA